MKQMKNNLKLRSSQIKGLEREFSYGTFTKNIFSFNLLSSNNECNGLSDFEFTGYVNGKLYYNKFLLKDIINIVLRDDVKCCFSCNVQKNKLNITTDSSNSKFQTLTIMGDLIKGTLIFYRGRVYVDGAMKQEQRQQLCLN